LTRATLGERPTTNGARPTTTRTHEDCAKRSMSAMRWRPRWAFTTHSRVDVVRPRKNLRLNVDRLSNNLNAHLSA
jgi:hypothetical protein